MTAAWVVRGGHAGEHEHWNLDHGRVSVGWSEVGDLAPCQSRDDVRALVDAAYPTDPPGRLANWAVQLWTFRDAIKPGDLVMMPLKTRRGYIWFGRCTGPFEYLDGEADASRRKTLPVKWDDEPVAKSGIKSVIIFSLGASQTVFSPTRHNAAARLEQVAKNGIDPGSTGVIKPAKGAPVPAGDSADSDVTDPDTAPTLEAIRDRIRTHLVENFKGHKLTALVADILEALGFVCEVSPPGPDGGVDILAGRGPLGLDSPTLIVEVKSEPTAIGVEVVRGLHSAMTQHRADQGLLVAWGGVGKKAKSEFERDRTSFRIWDAEEVLDRLFATYDRLPATTRASIPLKQAWVLDDEGDA